MAPETSSPAAIRFLIMASAVIVAQRHAAVASFSIPDRLPSLHGCRRRHRASASLPLASPRATAASSLSMAGMGAPAATKKKAKRKGGSKGKSSRGMGRGEPSREKYDVAKAMVKSEKLYEELMGESTRALRADDDDEPDDADFEMAMEYVVVARCAPGTTLAKKGGAGRGALASASDWIPVAQICVLRLVSGNDADDDRGGIHPSVPLAVSRYRREVHYTATLAAPALASLPRNAMEYGVEPLDSFRKYVHGVVIEGKAMDSYDVDGSKVGMTKSKAREVLGIESGCTDAAVVKRAYKKQSMAYHPDRFVNGAKTKEEMDETSNQFAMVKMAYEALNSGVRSSGGDGDASGNNGDVPRHAPSWYESLGGKSRTDFTGPIELPSVGDAGASIDKAFRCAVTGLDPDLTMSFVARNQAAAL